MTMSQVERIVRRRLVRAFIEADSIQVQLVRQVNRTKTEAGGWVTFPAPALPPQTARIVPSKRRFDNGLVNSEAGQIPHSEWLLLGFYNLDVEVNDTFLWQGSHYRITGILPNREERTLCSMTYHGESNS